MAELTDAARDWLRERHQAVLVTLRADGSPQSSNVATAFDGATFGISVTDSRAKTRNLRRDPRAIVHVLGPDFWSYASVTCQAEPGPVTTEPGDQAGRARLALYEAISGKQHPDPDDFFRAMTAEDRLVLRLHPQGIAGHGWA